MKKTKDVLIIIVLILVILIISILLISFGYQKIQAKKERIAYEKELEEKRAVMVNSIRESMSTIPSDGPSNRIQFN